MYQLVLEFWNFFKPNLYSTKQLGSRELEGCLRSALSALLRLIPFPSCLPLLMQNTYTVWGRSVHLSLLKASLLLVPYRDTTVSALFLPGNKPRWTAMFPFSPSPPHWVSSPRKTSSAALPCVCIVWLSSAVVLPLCSSLPVRKDHKPFNYKHSSYVVAPMGQIDTPSDLSSKDEKNSSFRPAQYSYSLRSSSDQPCPVPHLSTRLLMFLMSFFFFSPFLRI